MIKIIILTVLLSLKSIMTLAEDRCGALTPVPNPLFSEQFLPHLAGQYGHTAVAQLSTSEWEGQPVATYMPASETVEPPSAKIDGEPQFIEALPLEVKLSKNGISLINMTTEDWTLCFLNTLLKPDLEIDPLFIQDRVLTPVEWLNEKDILECLESGTRDFMSLYNLGAVETEIILTRTESLIRFLFIMEEFFFKVSTKNRGLIYKGILNLRDELQGRDRNQINNYLEFYGIDEIFLKGANKIKKLIIENGGYNNFIESIFTIKKKFDLTSNPTGIRRKLRNKFPEAFAKEKVVPQQVTHPRLNAVEDDLSKASNLSKAVISLTNTTLDGWTVLKLNTLLKPDLEIDPLFIQDRVLIPVERLNETDILECLESGTRDFMSLYNLGDMETEIILSRTESLIRFLFIIEEFFLKVSSKNRGLIYKGILNLRDKFQGKDRDQINDYLKLHGIDKIFLRGANKIKKLIIENGGYDHFIENIFTLKKKFDSATPPNHIRKQLRAKSSEAFAKEKVVPQQVTLLKVNVTEDDLPIVFNLSKAGVSFTNTTLDDWTVLKFNTLLKPDLSIDPLFIDGRILYASEKLMKEEIFECIEKGTRNLISLYNLHNFESGICLTLQESMIRFLFIMEEFFIKISNKEREASYKSILNLRDELQGQDRHQINDYFKARRVIRLLSNGAKKINKLIVETGGYDHFIENIFTIKKKFDASTSPNSIRRQLRAKFPDIFIDGQMISQLADNQTLSTKTGQKRKHSSLEFPPPQLESSLTYSSAILEPEQEIAKRPCYDAELVEQAMEEREKTAGFPN